MSQSHSGQVEAGVAVEAVPASLVVGGGVARAAATSESDASQGVERSLESVGPAKSRGGGSPMLDRYSDEGLAGLEAGDAPVTPPENGATTTPVLGSELITNGRCMSAMNSNCVEHCAPIGAYKAPAPDSNVTAPKKGGVGYLVAKRFFDIVFSAGVCLVLAVPVAVACAAICIDTPGKPFFRQERIGQGGKKIHIFKLRTMVSDANDHPERYMSSAQLETWKREQKLDDDPRITCVGKILRRTSVDELPQFMNVLSGDLSVIGPRPVTLAETYEYGDAREEVLSCKPGITGWWAATDRNDSTWESGQRQARELFYVRHQSFGLDARVFVKTFKAMRRGK